MESPGGVLLISTLAAKHETDEPRDNLLFSYVDPPEFEVDRLKNLAIAVSGAGRAVSGQQVRTMLLSHTTNHASLRLAFVQTQEVLLVQLLPGHLCSRTAAAAALWLLHMLLFFLGPWSNWLQQDSNSGIQLKAACSQALLQLLPVLLGRLTHLAVRQPHMASLLLSVGLPAVQLPLQLQQQLWGKLQGLQQLLPGWLPVAVPEQQQEQLMVPSCCLFHRGCLLLSSVRPWLAQRLWGLAWTLGLHCRTGHHPPAVLLQDAYVNLAAAHGCSCSSSSSYSPSNSTAAPAAVVAGYLGDLVEAVLLDKSRVCDLSMQLTQQLQAFETAAAAAEAAGAAAAGSSSSSSSDAVDLVQPCTAVAVCLGAYTFVVVLDRLPDRPVLQMQSNGPEALDEAGEQEIMTAAAAAAAVTSLDSSTRAAAAVPAEPAAGSTSSTEAAAVAAATVVSDKAAATSPTAVAQASSADAAALRALEAVLPLLLSSLAQMLVSHGQALQQQLTQTCLPAAVAAAVAAAAGSCTPSHSKQQQSRDQDPLHQPQQQQQMLFTKQQTSGLDMPRNHAMGAGRAAAAATGSTAASCVLQQATGASLHKPSLLSRLLRCWHSDDSVVEDAATAAAAATNVQGATAAADTERDGSNIKPAASTPSATAAAAAATGGGSGQVRSAAAAAAECYSSTLLSDPCSHSVRARQLSSSSSGSSSAVRALQRMLSRGLSGTVTSGSGVEQEVLGVGFGNRGLGSRQGSNCGLGANAAWLLGGVRVNVNNNSKRMSEGDGWCTCSAAASAAGRGKLQAAAGGTNPLHNPRPGQAGSNQAAPKAGRQQQQQRQAAAHLAGATADPHCVLEVDWQQGTFTAATAPPNAAGDDGSGVPKSAETAAAAATALKVQHACTHSTLSAAAALVPKLQQLLPRALQCSSSCSAQPQQQCCPAAQAGAWGALNKSKSHAIKHTSAPAAAPAAASAGPLLPHWSLCQLERHAAAAGVAGGAVLDADGAPWQQHPELAAVLVGLQRVQLLRGM